MVRNRKTMHQFISPLKKAFLFSPIYHPVKFEYQRKRELEFKVSYGITNL